VIAHLTACILALAVMRTAPVEIYHRQFRGDIEERAPMLARDAVHAGQIYDIDPVLILSDLWLESALDRNRVSPVGCVGIGQFCGAIKAAYTRACRELRSRYACDSLAVMLAARELRKGFDACGSEVGAVSYYRSGTCAHVNTWRVQQVLALRDELRWGFE
jgi:hypothetical protein